MNFVQISHTGRGSRQQNDDSDREIDSGPEVKSMSFQKAYNIIFNVKAEKENITNL